VQTRIRQLDQTMGAVLVGLYWFGFCSFSPIDGRFLVISISEMADVRKIISVVIVWNFLSIRIEKYFEVSGGSHREWTRLPI